MKKTQFLSFILCICFVFSLLPVMPSSAASSRVDSIRAGMTLRDKVTQMLMVDFRYWNGTGFTNMNEQVRSIVRDYRFGAIIYFAQNLIGTEQSLNLTMAMQEATVSNGGIPMIISADQEGGTVYRLGTGTALPGNMALGAAVDTKYAKSAGEIVGSELSVLGINTTLAPVVDVNNNPNNPVIGLRSYGDDPVQVGTLASGFIDGLKEYNVIGCAKHFPGHGDTATDSHYGLPSVNKSKTELMANELMPYRVAIENGIEMIMSAHILYPQLDNSSVYSERTGGYEKLPATLSKTIITDLLKGEMGFSGIVITDAMNMAGISNSWTQTQAVKLAIKAGVDMICMPCTLSSTSDLANLDNIINSVVSAVQSGEIPESRINDAVTRILTVKENRGILDFDNYSYTVSQAKQTVGSDINRQKERELSAAAVTVVKNKNNVLPLKLTSSSKVLMLCPYDNERAQLVMGWNRALDAGLVPSGAEMKYIRFSSSSLTSAIQSGIDWADTVLVISEVSSASRMEYDHWLSAGPNNFVNYCAQTGKKSIVMSADKPYDVQSYPNADVIMAVYGCMGSSVDPTEALVGGVTSSETAYGPNIIAGVEVALGVFPATGKLPVNVYKFNNGSNSYTSEIVYPRGYGLSYDSDIHLANNGSSIIVHAAKEAAVHFLTAFYDKDGRFIKLYTAPRTLPQGVSYLTMDEITKFSGITQTNEYLATQNGNGYARIFTWNSLTGSIPVGNIHKIQ